MSFSIPSGVWQAYYDVCNQIFLGDDHFSRLCTLYYPPIKEACANCTTQWMGGVSKNVFQHGGPAPVSSSDCSYCAGNGYREKEVTETVRLRIYWNKKDWIKTGNIVVADGTAQIIGKITDLPKIRQCNEIHIVSEQRELEIRAKLISQPVFHGFGKNQFFVAYIQSC